MRCWPNFMPLCRNRICSVTVDAVAWTQQYLRLHLSEDISILMLAKALGISRSTLHEQF